eukprot:GHRR01025521.1.p1 GENE.GHRR01025521.1~~GHRR01025521.1.p1  ORF type:complete len:134 (+),score=25.18 GHRR01025521.1:316-717(+)
MVFWWNINCRVYLEKPYRFEHEADCVAGHNGVVLRPHKMCDTKSVPNDRVCSQQRLVLQATTESAASVKPLSTTQTNLFLRSLGSNTGTADATDNAAVAAADICCYGLPCNSNSNARLTAHATHMAHHEHLHC